jgi:hypothetical protein
MQKIPLNQNKCPAFALALIFFGFCLRLERAPALKGRGFSRSGAFAFAWRSASSAAMTGVSQESALAAEVTPALH